MTLIWVKESRLLRLQKGVRLFFPQMGADQIHADSRRGMQIVWVSLHRMLWSILGCVLRLTMTENEISFLIRGCLFRVHLKIGLRVNFCTTDISQSIFRKVNNL